MKKIIYSIGLFLFVICLGYAQKKGTNEILVSTGGFTTNYWFNKVTEPFLEILKTETYELEEDLPSLNLAYKRTFQNDFFLLTEISYQSLKQSIHKDKIKTGELQQSFVTIALGVEYHYLSEKWFQMYSGLNIGYTFQNSKEIITNSSNQLLTDNYLNFQLNALGFRVGRQLALTAELGIGYKGIFSLGGSFQF